MAAATRHLHQRPSKPRTQTSRQAIELIGEVERARRLAAVAAVDAIAEIEATRAFYDHGHANARVMYAHVAHVSGAEAHRLDKIRRMTAECDHIDKEWRDGRLSVDKAALLGQAFSNPRTRERFLLDQRWFIKRARRFGFVRFNKIIARWLDVHDVDGSAPEADPSHQRRYVRYTQDHFSKAWKLEASLGSLQGSIFNQVLRAYLEAEFNHDWKQAEKLHGKDTCHDLLPRTHNQRFADALCQMAADAVNSDKPSAPVKRVHNIVYTAEAYEEQLRRWAGGPARLLNPDRYNISDLDGNPINATAAFADSLVASLRRVIQNTAGVTINMGTQTRLFNGLARLGIQLTATECYWPGCNVPTSRCQMDHLRPAAHSGPSNQLNGLPACKRHNLIKERGYTVTRQPNGTITITTPTGDTVS